MAYQVLLTETARAELSSLGEKEKAACFQALKGLEKEGYQGLDLQGEMSGYRVIKVMRHRIVFHVMDRRVIVCAVGRRHNIYASLNRI